MKKIPSVFKRNYETDNLIRDEVVEGCEWVLAGEGVATRKWDGTSVLVRNGKLWKRYDAKGKTPPAGWEPCEPAGDPKTGHWPGWVPVGDGPEDWLYREIAARGEAMPDGTYELVGPKVNGNPDRFERHELVFHGDNGHSGYEWELMGRVRSFAGIRAWLAASEIEGLVFHHPDSRMAKVKRRDFGLPWPPNQPEAKGDVERKAVLEYLRRRSQQSKDDRGRFELEASISGILRGEHILMMRKERAKNAKAGSHE